ncbi:Tissue inhibitor of metalloproteinase [Trichostrongylus colubriformis]|uniref:Tissue inhibitor of metalloproteinase n=1 Tax=Trichostrongylus colubriformis TaxID=6319 RepID=A0AAN8IFT2_TRICO
MIRILIFSGTCIALSMACFCTPAQSTKESFCKADWVSHVKVLGMKTHHGSNGDTIYILEHKNVFKKPKDVKLLPNNINTPSSDAACGLKLLKDKEYLLAGAIQGGYYYITLRCSQIVDDKPLKTTEFGMPIEWKHVSQATKSSLKIINCDNHRIVTEA